MTSAVFVSYKPFVEKKSGGVQTCTNEYISLLKQSGFKLELCLFDGDRRLSTKIWRRLFTSPYFRVAEPNLIQRIDAACARTDSKIVFLNQTSLATLAPALKLLRPNVKIILLSHGLESTDLLHSIRLCKSLPISFTPRPFANIVLGEALLKETKLRADIDLVCTLSPQDAAFERWISARSVLWLPRTVTPAPLDWKPRDRRFGFVGTLDHAPNLEGLVDALDAMMSLGLTNLRIRVVGAPASLGLWLSRKYSIVDYLDALGDSELKAEASSWHAFIHPIFCLARGCSTKLATALAWQIPIVTTELGSRGYVWRRGQLIMADSPVAFAQECSRLLNVANGETVRRNVIDVADTSPSLEDNARKLREALQIKTFTFRASHNGSETR